jgi:hypothetical protein
VLAYAAAHAPRATPATGASSPGGRLAWAWLGGGLAAAALALVASILLMTGGPVQESATVSVSSTTGDDLREADSASRAVAVEPVDAAKREPAPSAAAPAAAPAQRAAVEPQAPEPAPVAAAAPSRRAPTEERLRAPVARGPVAQDQGSAAPVEASARARAASSASPLAGDEVSGVQAGRSAPAGGAGLFGSTEAPVEASATARPAAQRPLPPWVRTVASRLRGSEGEARQRETSVDSLDARREVPAMPAPAPAAPPASLRGDAPPPAAAAPTAGVGAASPGRAREDAAAEGTRSAESVRDPGSSAISSAVEAADAGDWALAAARFEAATTVCRAPEACGAARVGAGVAWLALGDDARARGWLERAVAGGGIAAGIAREILAGIGPR